MIAAEDLVLLARSFESALVRSSDAEAADVALHDLGWGDVLVASPLQGAAAAFTALGSSGAVAGLLDDVLANALGRPSAPDACIVMPAPGGSVPAGVRAGARIRIDGLVSSRVDRCTRAVVPILDGKVSTFVEVDAGLLRGAPVIGLDPDRPYRRVSVDVTASEATAMQVSGTWDVAVRDARVALAHQLTAASRVMLEQARQHALDRVQFGRTIGSFQAVRHKLAEVLVAIEGAAAVAGACASCAECDPLMAAVAKSVAGGAARLTASNAQQVLAGIGFTTDHPFHLSLKRTMVLDTIFGSARTLPSEIGRELLARRGAPRLLEL